MVGSDWGTLEARVDELIDLTNVLARENKALKTQGGGSPKTERILTTYS